MKEIRTLNMSDMELKNLYIWLDSFTLSRPRKNLSRDFSDARLVAEIIAYYNPKMFDINSFPTVNARNYKLSNWESLCRKALKYFNIELTQENIMDLVDGRPFAIENFLYVLKPKLDDNVFNVDKSFEKLTIKKSKTPNKNKTTRYNDKVYPESKTIDHLEREITELQLQLKEKDSIIEAQKNTIALLTYRVNSITGEYNK